MHVQIFTRKQHFAKIYPIDGKIKARDDLKIFCREFGVPENLTLDGSKQQNYKGTEYRKQ